MVKNIRRGLHDMQVGMTKFGSTSAQPKEIIGLTFGEPFQDTMQEVKDAAIASLLAGDTKYTDMQGIPDLRQKIADRTKSLYDVEYSKDDVIITTGATQSAMVVLMSLLDEGDEVICPTPCFILYQPQIELNHGTFVGYDTTGDGFQFVKEKLEALITEKTKAFIFTSPNNPTGLVYNQQSIDILVDLAKKYGFYILCDDIYDQILFTPQRPLISYQEIRSQIIILQSFSKSHAMTGWRMGWILADESISADIAKVASVSQSGVTTFIQKAGIRALDFDSKWLSEAFAEQADLACRKLDEYNLSYQRPDGAFYIFVNISEFGLDSYAFCERAMDEFALAIVPGRDFAPCADNFVRLSFVGDRDRLILGLDRLGGLAQVLRKEKQ